MGAFKQIVDKWSVYTKHTADDFVHALCTQIQTFEADIQVWCKRVFFSFSFFFSAACGL